MHAFPAQLNQWFMMEHENNKQNRNRTKTKKKKHWGKTLGNTKRTDGQQLKICWTCRAAGHKLKFQKTENPIQCRCRVTLDPASP